MKKSKIFLSLSLTMFAFLSNSCTQDEANIGENPDGRKAVTVKVVDGGYENKDNNTTRASESNEEESGGDGTAMKTQFIAGDKIGVFSISSGGASHYQNLELVYDGTNWKNPNGETFYYFSGMSYFAYYPYNKDFNMEKVDWSKHTAAEFFAEYVNEWRPQDDQSTTMKYIASDLMIGDGSVIDNTFTFTLGHTMGLIFISTAEEIKGTVYLFPKLTEGDAMEKLSSDSKIYSFEQKVYKPSRKQGYYRYLVKPGQAKFISGKNPDGRVFSFTCNNVSAGRYKKFVIDGEYNPANSEIEDFTVVPGDILFSDMHFAHTPASGNVTGYSSSIGVVMYLAGLHDEYTEGYTHGLVLRKQTVESSSEFWESSSKNYDSPAPNVVNVGQMMEDKSGLTNSLAINSTYYLKFTKAQSVGTKAYDQCSEWFIPSTGQWLKMICDYTGGHVSSALTATRPTFANVRSTYSKELGRSFEATGVTGDYKVTASGWGSGAFFVSSESTADGAGVWVFNLFTPSFSSGNKYNINGASAKTLYACGF